MNSKWTLAILLVVLVCQFLATGSAFSVQYPSGEHPMGAGVSHHHLHDLYDAERGVSERVAEQAESEHEHANHSHTQSYPPVDSAFMTAFFQDEILADDDFSYLDCRYAPPIQPPHV